MKAPGRLVMAAVAIFVVAPLHGAMLPKLPISFEENRGQTDPRVRFIANGLGYTLFITDSETVARLQTGKRGTVLRMRLTGANPHPTAGGEQPLTGRSNYFIGNDPAKWRTKIPMFERARLSNVYDDIDVVYYGNQGELEYDFIVRPGADPDQIRLTFEGAKAIDVDAAGDLVLHTDAGKLVQHLPNVYQETNGIHAAIKAEYRRVHGNTFGVKLGSHDSSRPLVVDPTLVYSTYLGGSQDEGNWSPLDWPWMAPEIPILPGKHRHSISRLRPARIRRPALTPTPSSARSTLQARRSSTRPGSADTASKLHGPSPSTQWGTPGSADKATHPTFPTQAADRSTPLPRPTRSW